MAKTISVLVLRLEGVLQSWGEHAKWNYRDSASMPTKSGIMGLLGCALGWEREDKRFLDLQSQFKIVVRADRQGNSICDFHTVQSTNLLNAEGKHRGSKGEYATLVTNRYYLQDACFTVFLIGERDFLKTLETALQKPQWPLYLGRKSCVPSRPVLYGNVREYETIEQAVKDIPLAERVDKSIMLEIEDDFENFTGNILYRPDEFTEVHREFANRTVMRAKFIKENTEENQNVSD